MEDENSLVGLGLKKGGSRLKGKRDALLPHGKNKGFGNFKKGQLKQKKRVRKRRGGTKRLAQPSTILARQTT